MFVTKRDGKKEPVNLEKIIKSVSRVCDGYEGVDFYKIATKTVGGLYDGVSTKELDQLSIQTAVGFILEDPVYSNVASRLLSNFIEKEVTNQEIHSFSQSIAVGFEQGLISEETYNFVMNNKRKLNAAIKIEKNSNFEYYGLKVAYDRYLLKHPTKRLVIETPQYWFLRVACGLNEHDVNEAVEMYNALSNFDYMASTPTLFNSGTRHSQMSSCYLLDSPMDDLRDIYKKYQDVALLSKWAGGIGLNLSDIRGPGSLIKGTNGKSDGITSWAHTLSASVRGVNQGGKRKGAACIYLETHHPDIMNFLEFRDNTGDVEKRTYNLNLANWIPDLFMERVDSDGLWSLFDPNLHPELTKLFGDEYKSKYIELELQGKFKDQIPARKIYARMMRTLAETGNGWMCFKDASNLRCNSAVNGFVVKNSNLCTEIIEPVSSGHYEYHTFEEINDKTKNIRVVEYDNEKQKFLTIDDAEVAVCNLASINLARMVKDGKLDKNKLRKVTAVAVKNLDRVIDKNFYPVPEAKFSNLKWRPVGLGIMGWQDMLFQLRLPFESQEAINLAREIQEEIYYVSLKTSNELAKENGKHGMFDHTHAARGQLQFDLAAQKMGYYPDYNDANELIGYKNSSLEVFPHSPTDLKRWNELKNDIKEYGLRNSLLIAIAPTATISGVVGVYECVEPQQYNLFKRETLSGDFIQSNKYLVNELKELGLWTSEVINKLVANNGSVQNILEIPENIRQLFKTSWEIKQKYIIDQAAARGVYIDQSQSTNLFMKSPTIDKLSSMYMYAWKNGLKTTYYLYSEPATEIGKVGHGKTEQEITNQQSSDNKNKIEICESCQ